MISMPYAPWTKTPQGYLSPDGTTTLTEQEVQQVVFNKGLTRDWLNQEVRREIHEQAMVEAFYDGNCLIDTGDRLETLERFRDTPHAFPLYPISDQPTEPDRHVPGGPRVWPEDLIREVRDEIVSAVHGLPWDQEAVHPELFADAENAARAAMTAMEDFVLQREEVAFGRGQKSGLRHADRLHAAEKIGRPDLPGPMSPNPYRKESGT
ncbi:hypothetical protein LG293_16075 (plasmid) [Citricoccus nitrophenolicus]